MYGVRHPITEDFPSFSSDISQLKTKDPQFAQLLTEYDQTDKKIYGLEIMSRPVADTYVDALKKRRVVLKDKIYHALIRRR